MAEPTNPTPPPDDGLAEPPNPLATPQQADEFWSDEERRAATPVPMPNRMAGDVPAQKRPTD